MSDANGDAKRTNHLGEEITEQFHDISLHDNGKSNVDDDELKNNESDDISDANKSDVTAELINCKDNGDCHVNQSQLSSGKIQITDEMQSTMSDDSLRSTPLCSIGNDDDDDDDDRDDDIGTDDDLNNTLIELSKKNGILMDIKQLEEKYEEKILELQLVMNDLQNQNEEIKEKLKENESHFNEVKSRLLANVERANRQAEVSRKEMETMVMKYATSEKDVIVVKKAKEESDKKLRDAIKDKDALMVRIRGITNEKTLLMANHDKKVTEFTNLQKDYDKLNNDVKDRDTKLKLSQSKLKDEVNAHQETQRKLDNAHQTVSDLVIELENLKKEYQKLIQNDANRIEDEKNEKTLNDHLQCEITNNKRKLTIYTEENQSLTMKIQTLERERLDHEQTVSKLKESNNELSLEISNYISKLNETDQIKMCLEKERLQKDALQRENERLNNANMDMKSEMESCRHKEGELLEFTERLTARTVQLQSEHNILEQKCEMLRSELDDVKRQFNVSVKENLEINEKMSQLKVAHQNEITLLAKKLAEKTNVNDELKLKIDEIQNEHRVMKKRHVTSLKELNKELLIMKKRLEHYEGQIPVNHDIVSLSSRTSSSNSLDTIAGQSQNNLVTANPTQHNQQKVNSQIPQNEHNPCSSTSLSTMPEVDKQMLIDRIIRLQKSLAKRNEKIDFLEEHNYQLMTDLKKKSKIIQNYVLREETGALSTSIMDDHKKGNHKRQLAKRGGGIMASLYNSTPIDSSMTLELSLEINKKLQEVLEDTILKNITLKENMNTLGDEIAKFRNTNDDKE